MKKIKLFTLTLIFVTVQNYIVLAQNDPTTDKWEDNGINLITTSSFGGHVGIGTNTPTRPFSVFSPTSGVISLLESGHPTGTLLDIKSSTAGDAGLRFQGGRTWTIGNDKGLSDSFIITRFNGFPTNTSNNRKDLVITGVGNIGFGEVNPSDKVEINSNGGGLDLTHNSSTSFSSIESFEMGTSMGAIQFIGSDFTSVPRKNNVEIVNRTSLGHVDFYTKDSFGLPRLRVHANGRIGIGRTTPADKLEVSDATHPAIRLSDNSGDFGQLSLATSDGFYSPFSKKGDVVLRSLSGSTIVNSYGINGAIRFGTGNGTNTEKMTIVNNGNVGIANVNPQSKLHVNGDARIEGKIAIGISAASLASGYLLGVDGKVLCEELRVKNSVSWPDYVFDKEYDLMPLKELASYISQNNHLPEIPSAQNVERDGIEVGKMNAALLKKIEELTLYLLKLSEENDLLKSRVLKLEDH